MAKIFLAGAEAIELFKTVLENESQDVMLSFFYVQKRGAMPAILKLLRQYPHVKVFMDSGAATFGKQDHGDPQTYWKAYYDFLKQYGHHFEYASEFDIDGYKWDRKGKAIHVSDEQITIWREDLAELGTVPIVPVWHESRGVAAWENLCKDARYPHLAISPQDEISRGEGGKLIGQAHSWGKTVHGYVSEVLTDLKFLKYDTIATTTWLVGQKFGDVCIFERGNYKRIYAKQGKKERTKYRNYFKSIGCDPVRILADDRKEINRANIIAWNLLSKKLQLINGRKRSKNASTAPVQHSEPTPRVSTAENENNGAETITDGSPAVLVGPENIGHEPAHHEPAHNPHNQVQMLPQPMQTITVEKEQEDPIHLQKYARPFIAQGIPQLRCHNCALQNDCPKFDPEATVCAFKDQFALVGTGDVSDLLEELASIFAVNVERGRYMRLAEELMQGGVGSMEITKHLDMTFAQGKALAELMKGKKRSKATAQGAGLLDRMFEGFNQPSEPVQIAGEKEYELPSDDEIENEIDEENLTDRQKNQTR